MKTYLHPIRNPQHCLKDRGTITSRALFLKSPIPKPQEQGKGGRWWWRQGATYWPWRLGTQGLGPCSMHPLFWKSPLAKIFQDFRTWSWPLALQETTPNILFANRTMVGMVCFGFMWPPFGPQNEAVWIKALTPCFSLVFCWRMFMLFQGTRSLH